MRLTKQKLMIACLIMILLFACLPKETNSAVCTLKENQTEIIINAKYDHDELIEVIEVKFSQTFSKKAVSDLSDTEIIDTLTSIFKEGNDKVHIEVNYEHSKRRGEVYLNVPLDTLSKDELAKYDLQKDVKLQSFINKMKDKNYTCEVKE